MGVHGCSFDRSVWLDKDETGLVWMGLLKCSFYAIYFVEQTFESKL